MGFEAKAIFCRLNISIRSNIFSMFKFFSMLLVARMYGSSLIIITRSSKNLMKSSSNFWFSYGSLCVINAYGFFASWALLSSAYFDS